MRIATEITTQAGPLTLVADKKGICRIILPHASPHVEDSRRDRNAVTDHPLLAKAAEQVREYFAGRRKTFQLPLSLQGTAFQRAVWNLLAGIPYGTTRSYSQLARQLGKASLARAVGGAAHANPLPLIIPCHRLVGADGSLTGFAGGLQLKKMLLELEGVQISTGKNKIIIEKQSDNR